MSTARSTSRAIRPYRPSDAEDVVRVFLASTVSGQDFLPEAFWREQAREVCERFLPITETWIAEEGGEVVAFASLLDDLIGGLFTHPDQQGAGHGGALVEHVHVLHDPLFVEVFEANERARAFYRRRGCVESERRVHAETGLVSLTLRSHREPPNRCGALTCSPRCS